MLALTLAEGKSSNSSPVGMRVIVYLLARLEDAGVVLLFPQLLLFRGILCRRYWPMSRLYPPDCRMLAELHWQRLARERLVERNLRIRGGSK
jgi:hypothetical protein